jgi:hypothetical protein
MDAAAGAIEEVARVVAHIRRRWPGLRILLRADSGFAREDLMAWCEANGVDFLFGLARTSGSFPRSRPNLIWSAPRADVPAARSATSRASCGRRADLEPTAPDRGQGRVDPRRSQSPFRGDLARTPPMQGQIPVREGLLRRGAWRTGSRNANSTSTPTAPRPPPCGLINCPAQPRGETILAGRGIANTNGHRQ